MRDRSIQMIAGAIVLAIVLIGAFHDYLLADSMPHWRLNNGTGDIWWGTGLMLFAFIIVGLVLSIAILLYRSLELSISSDASGSQNLDSHDFTLPNSPPKRGESWPYRSNCSGSCRVGAHPATDRGKQIVE